MENSPRVNTANDEESENENMTMTVPDHVPVLRDWFDRRRQDFDAVVMDVDGVLVRGGRALPGAVEWVANLRRRDIPLRLLTNDGCTPIQKKAAILRKAGLDFAPEAIVSSSHALAPLARKRGWRGSTFFIMGDLGDPCYAEAAGLRTSQDPERIRECAGVLVGEGPYNWRITITAIFNWLRESPDVPVVVPNPDEFFPGHGNDLIPASGAIARFIQQLCRTAGTPMAPIYLGKPYRPIFATCHELLEKQAGRTFAPERVLFVGDSIDGDIPGSRAFGYRSALVLTGITNWNMVRERDVFPEIVADHL
jgi:4-nitrophenyl phosphatase